MATIYYVADGAGIDTTTTAGTVPAATLAATLVRYFARLREDNPVINPHLPFSHYHRNVVIQVGASEANDKFRRAGFYEIVGLSPTRCQELFSLPR